MNRIVKALAGLASVLAILMILIGTTPIALAPEADEELYLTNIGNNIHHDPIEVDDDAEEADEETSELDDDISDEYYPEQLIYENGAPAGKTGQITQAAETRESDETIRTDNSYTETLTTTSSVVAGSDNNIPDTNDANALVLLVSLTLSAGILVSVVLKNRKEK